MGRDCSPSGPLIQVVTPSVKAVQLSALRQASRPRVVTTWINDHKELVEAWTVLTYLATATKRLRFGTVVSPMTFRHPSMIALQATAVDELSGGRLWLGLGAGWNDEEHLAFGITLPPMKERMDRFEEGVEVVHALLTSQPASYQGTYYSLQNAIVAPLPTQKPHTPIFIGGKGEQRTLRIAARYADEWNFPGPSSVAQFKAKSEVLDERCAEVGRDPRSIHRSAMVVFVIGESDAELSEHATAIERFFGGRVGTGLGDNPARLRAEKGWLVGRPEQIVEQIKEYQTAGAQGLMLQHLAHEQFRPLELLAQHVLPAFA